MDDEFCVRAVRLLNFLLLAALFAGSLLVWPDLPQQIPAHFGLSGEVDRWSETSLLSWLMIPLVTLGLSLLLYGVSFHASRSSRFLNMPDQKRFDALPPGRQREVLGKMSEGLEILCLLLILTFCLVQVIIYFAAQGNETKGLFAVILVLTALTTPIAAIALHLRVQSEITRQDRIERGMASAGSG